MGTGLGDVAWGHGSPLLEAASPDLVGKVCFGDRHVFLILSCRRKILPSPPLPPLPGSCWQIPILHFPTAGLLNPSSWKRLPPALASRLPSHSARGYWGPLKPPGSQPRSSQQNGVTQPPKNEVPLSCFSRQNRGESGALLTPGPPTPLSFLSFNSPTLPCTGGSSQSCGQTDSCRDGWGLPHFPKALQSPAGVSTYPPATPFHTFHSQSLLWDHRPGKHILTSAPQEGPGWGWDAPQVLPASVSLLIALCKAKPCSTTTSAKHLFL